MRLLAAALVAAFLAAPGVAAAESQVSPYVVIMRCRGGCLIHGGVDDARANASSLPCPGGANCQNGGCFCQGGASGDYMIEEFQNAQGQTGAAADAEWAEIMQCIREIYSPYGVLVTETPPTGGTSFNVGIAAGRPENIGYGANQVGGIAPGTPGCDPRENVISFSFANIYAGPQRVKNICETIAQETAHAYGLDHAYMFTDGRSACTDPMTYRNDCGGQKFFRNAQAQCGEFGSRRCSCSATQNSHQRLINIFGEGTPITTPPTLVVSSPTSGATIDNGHVVRATSGAQRGVARVELWLNDYLWATAKGVVFGPTGQPTAEYTLPLPADVPDGIIDVVVKAFDDIEVETDSPVITVTKGAPCTSAATCAKGQQCEEGRCFWAPPTGKTGDACDYPQFCENGFCLDASDGMYCSQTCVVGTADSCPVGFVCFGEAGQAGSCVHESAGEGGCCSAGSDGGAAALLSLGVLGLLARRRKS